MEEDDENPIEIDSDHVDRALLTNVVYLNKKRKFEAEQLGLPLTKQKCFGLSISSRCESSMSKIFDVEDFHIIREEGELIGGSDPKSARDSNSFAADSDSAVSSFVESKSEPEISKKHAYCQPSTSIADWRDIEIMIDTSKEEVVYMAEEYDSCHLINGLYQCQNLEDHLLEFGNPADFAGSGYGDEATEQCEGKDLGDMLYSNGVNPNSYVLSSGRWSVNQEAESSSTKPTIDQEFEQYFSALML